MKRQNKKWIVISALGFTLLISTIIAQGRGMRGDDPLRGILTDDQKEQMHELRMEMREAGHSRIEIRGAMDELLSDWGYDPPEHRRGNEGCRGRHGAPDFFEQLTPDQTDVLHELRIEMKEDGASREEIHAAVVQRLEAWGIDVPEPFIQQGPRGGHGRPEFMEALSDDQQDMIQDLVHRMRDEGADREEIREAVHQQLTLWGIDIPDRGRQAQRNREGGKRSLGASRNFPNPFNPETTIHYSLVEPGIVKISVYDIAGREIRAFEDTYRTAGEYSIVWNGKDQQGQSVPAGMYFYQIQMGDELVSERMILLK